MPGKAATAERIRDLKSQIANLSAEEVGDILFLEISPGREPVTVYSVEDGSPVPVPAYRINEVMGLTDKDGNPRFVAEAKDAPEYRPGTVKCFLHKDSPERPILEMIGLQSATCPKGTLANDQSKRMHALHRHKNEWVAYQGYVEDQKEEKREKRLDSQLDATLALAGGGQKDGEFLDEMSAKVHRDPQKVVRAVKGECDICGRTGLKRVKAHKSMAHK
jgi:hypothetical protein